MGKRKLKLRLKPLDKLSKAIMEGAWTEERIEVWHRVESLYGGVGDKEISRFMRRATLGSVGYDLYAREVYVNWNKGLVVYKTGLKLDMTKFMEEFTRFKYVSEFSGYIMGLVFPRSSVFRKSDLLCMPNSVGVIDQDYTGEVLVIYRLRKSLGSFIRWLIGKLDIYEVEERVAQIVFTTYYLPKFTITDQEPDSERGKKGFGSSGDK